MAVRSVRARPSPSSRVRRTAWPRARSSAARRRATAMVRSRSVSPLPATAPVSLPPWPGSMTMGDGPVRSRTRTGAGVGVGNDPAELENHAGRAVEVVRVQQTDVGAGIDEDLLAVAGDRAHPSRSQSGARIEPRRGVVETNDDAAAFDRLGVGARRPIEGQHQRGRRCEVSRRRSHRDRIGKAGAGRDAVALRDRFQAETRGDRGAIDR